MNDTKLYISRYTVLRPTGLIYPKDMSINTPAYKVTENLFNFAI